MSVLQIVKDLAGEQDINWGDSDTQFNRQTHTGGSVAINYVDAKSIPANALGGVVDTHLHEQNTDTGTDSTTWTLASGGNQCIISNTGLTGSRAFTFPDSSQRLVGVTDLAAVTNGNGASTVGIEDSAGYFTATEVEAALAEMAVDVAAVQAYRGYKRGFILDYSSATTITIAGGMWDHIGTTTQNVYTNVQTSFICGSGGSNAASDDISGTNLHYVYVDDSAVVTSGSALLTASEFLNDKTAPAYSHAKAGWYNGLDRCIGAISTNSGNVRSFNVHSSNMYSYATSYPELRASAAAPTSAEEQDLSPWVPIFSTRAYLKITGTTEDQQFAFAPGAAVWEVDYLVTPSPNDDYHSIEVLLDTGQSTWLTCNTNGTITLNIAGYYQNEL